MIISMNIRAKNKSKILRSDKGVEELESTGDWRCSGPADLRACFIVDAGADAGHDCQCDRYSGDHDWFFLIGYFLRKELAAGNNDLIKGLVIVCIGIFICVKSELVVSVLPVVLGIGVVLSGILKLQHAFDLKRMGFDTWVRIGLTAAVNIFIGLIVILNPFSTVAWLMRLVGIGFLFSGVTDLITTIYVSKKASEYYVDGKAEETDEEIK